MFRKYIKNRKVRKELANYYLLDAQTHFKSKGHIFVKNMFDCWNGVSLLKIKEDCSILSINAEERSSYHRINSNIVNSIFKAAIKAKISRDEEVVDSYIKIINSGHKLLSDASNIEKCLELYKQKKLTIFDAI